MENFLENIKNYPVLETEIAFTYLKIRFLVNRLNYLLESQYSKNNKISFLAKKLLLLIHPNGLNRYHKNGSYYYQKSFSQKIEKEFSRDTFKKINIPESINFLLDQKQSIFFNERESLELKILESLRRYSLEKIILEIDFLIICQYSTNPKILEISRTLLSQIPEEEIINNFSGIAKYRNSENFRVAEVSKKLVSKINGNYKKADFDLIKKILKIIVL